MASLVRVSKPSVSGRSGDMGRGKPIKEVSYGVQDERREMEI